MKWLLIIAALYETVVGVAEMLDFSQALTGLTSGGASSTVDTIAQLPSVGTLLASGQLNIVAGVIDAGAGLLLFILALRV